MLSRRRIALLLIGLTACLEAPRAAAEESGSRAKATGGEGPATYFVVPLRGSVGGEISARAIETALKYGLRDEDTILILEIDSPGGLVSECEKIIDLLGKHRERRSIALVNKKALSAAAILALTCDEIYIDPAGLIGAATAIRQGEDGPTAVEEKFASVWRATCRKAAEIGGHDPLFADAMVDAEVALHLAGEEGHRRLGRGPGIPGDTVVSPAGKLFTATAREAEQFGLALGLASKLDDIEAKDPSLSSWKSASTRGISIMKAEAAGFARATKRIDKELEDAKKNFELAVEYDPGRQSYRVGKGNRFTPDSRRKWQRYSARCYGYLGKCEDALEDAVKLTEKFPILQGQGLLAGEQLKQVEKIRDAIKRRAKRQGI